MTPKEKAKKLVDKYKPLSAGFSGGKMNEEFSKQGALIAVNEIKEAIDWHEYKFPDEEYNYWEQVEKEIRNL